MKRTSILVCGDAGAAGRVLLARRDLDVSWALTDREARAVLDARIPRVVISSEDLAGDVLPILKRMPDAPPCIVLIQSDGWDRRDLHFAGGATALAPETSAERIFEGISELTGVRFAACPRVAYETVVDVRVGDDHYFAETVDISASGVGLGGIEIAEVGLGVEMTFSMMEPAVTCRGMIVRLSDGPGPRIAGVAFSDIDPGDRARIAELVDSERRVVPELPEPIGLTVDLVGPLTMDVSEAVERDEKAPTIYRVMLAEAVGNRNAPAPSWLGRVAESLTPIERDCLSRSSAPGWVTEAIEHRISLRRSRNDICDDLSREAEGKRVLEFVCRLSDQCELETDDVARAVTKIRADLLREIMGMPSRRKPAARSPKRSKKPVARTKLERRTIEAPRR